MSFAQLPVLCVLSAARVASRYTPSRHRFTTATQVFVEGLLVRYFRSRIPEVRVCSDTSESDRACAAGSRASSSVMRGA